MPFMHGAGVGNPFWGSGQMQGWQGGSFRRVLATLPQFPHVHGESMGSRWGVDGKSMGSRWEVDGSRGDSEVGMESAGLGGRTRLPRGCESHSCVPSWRKMPGTASYWAQSLSRFPSQAIPRRHPCHVTAAPHGSKGMGGASGEWSSFPPHVLLHHAAQFPRAGAVALSRGGVESTLPPTLLPVA
eukprot:gene22630-biopygen22253